MTHQVPSGSPRTLGPPEQPASTLAFPAAMAGAGSRPGGTAPWAAAPRATPKAAGVGQPQPPVLDDESSDGNFEEDDVPSSVAGGESSSAEEGDAARTTTPHGATPAAGPYKPSTPAAPAPPEVPAPPEALAPSVVPAPQSVPAAPPAVPAPPANDGGNDGEGSSDGDFEEGSPSPSESDHEEGGGGEGAPPAAGPPAPEAPAPAAAPAQPAEEGEGSSEGDFEEEGVSWAESGREDGHMPVEVLVKEAISAQESLLDKLHLPRPPLPLSPSVSAGATSGQQALAANSQKASHGSPGTQPAAKPVASPLPALPVVDPVPASVVSSHGASDAALLAGAGGPAAVPLGSPSAPPPPVEHLESESNSEASDGEAPSPVAGEGEPAAVPPGSPSAPPPLAEPLENQSGSKASDGKAPSPVAVEGGPGAVPPASASARPVPAEPLESERGNEASDGEAPSPAAGEGEMQQAVPASSPVVPEVTQAAEPLQGPPPLSNAADDASDARGRRLQATVAGSPAVDAMAAAAASAGGPPVLEPARPLPDGGSEAGSDASAERAALAAMEGGDVAMEEVHSDPETSVEAQAPERAQDVPAPPDSADGNIGASPVVEAVAAFATQVGCSLSSAGVGPGEPVAAAPVSPTSPQESIGSMDVSPRPSPKRPAQTPVGSSDADRGQQTSSSSLQPLPNEKSSSGSPPAQAPPAPAPPSCVEGSAATQEQQATDKNCAVTVTSGPDIAVEQTPGNCPTSSAPSLQTIEVSALKSCVAKNPRAFDEWMKLIGLLEEGGQPGDIRSVYMSFLAEFPLCWGYWKRLADLEAREHNSEAALAVYENGVKVASPCVDLWYHFLDAIRAAAADGRKAEVRTHMERAVDAVGMDWRAGPVWDRYLDLEQAEADWPQLGAVFRRALSVPMEGLAGVRIRLRSLIIGDACPPIDQLCSAEELKEFTAMDLLDVAVGRPQAEGPTAPRPATMWDQMPANANAQPRLASGNQPKGLDKPAVATVTGQPKPPSSTKAASKSTPKEAMELEDGELSEGEVSGEEPEPSPPPPPQLAPSQPAAHWPFTAVPVMRPPQGPAPGTPPPLRRASRWGVVSNAQEQRKMLLKDWFLEAREAQFQRTAAEAEQLRQFEQHLQRPYFHNQALSEGQLEAWRRYLDFEEQRQPRDERRLRALYQRCLVATNNYLEFWLRYGALLEAASGPEAPRHLLAGAWASGRLRLRPDALAAWTELEEQCGNPDRARQLLDEGLGGFARGSVELALRRVALERRAGDLQRCEALLREFAEEATLPAARAFLAIYRARFVEDALQRPKQAREVLLQAWQEGLRELPLLTELCPLLLRAGAAEAAEAGSAHGEGPATEAMQKCLSLFEEALDPATTTYSANEARAAWAAFVDFLVAHGAPLPALRAAQRRARREAAAGGRGAARPWPGTEPPAKAARTEPARPPATPQQAAPGCAAHEIADGMLWAAGP